MDEREVMERTLVQIKCILRVLELNNEKQEIDKRIAENPNPQGGDYAEAIVDMLIIKAQLDAVMQLKEKAEAHD